MTTTTIDEELAALRGEVARRQILIYRLAPHVPLNPGRLGAVLRGRSPVDAALLARIRAAIDAAAREGVRP
jgi:hypothetical protein